MTSIASGARPPTRSSAVRRTRLNTPPPTETRERGSATFHARDAIARMRRSVVITASSQKLVVHTVGNAAT